MLYLVADSQGRRNEEGKAHKRPKLQVDKI
jgi:hypothetical protein